MLPFWTNFHLSIIGHPGYLILLTMLVIGFSLFIYRHTNPVVARPVHYFLVAARMLTLVILLLVLFQTAASWQRREKIPPLLAVMIDQSASMNVRDSAGDRPTIIRRIVAHEISQYLDSHLQRKYFGFAAHAAPLSSLMADSLDFQGDATNLSGSLQEVSGILQQENLSGILLLTDGNYTQGGNPVRFASEWNIPLFIIGIGTPDDQPDLAITDAEANAFAFVNEPTPIRISIHSKNFQHTSTRLRLMDDKGEIDAITIPITNSPKDSSVTFHYTPRIRGRQRLTAELSAKTNEQTVANNTKTIYLDVLESRLQILILAGGISADIGFLRRHLSSDRFAIHLLIDSPNFVNVAGSGIASSVDSLDQYDLMIFYDFPTAGTAARLLSELQVSLNNRHRPLIFIAGKDIDEQRLQLFADYLPIKADVITGEEVAVLPQLTATGKQHPVLQIPQREISAWNLLPPIFMRHKVRTPWPDAEILALARMATAKATSGEEGWPLILVRNSVTKSAAIMGYELWRWHLMMAGIGNEDNVYHHFFNNLIRWLQIEKRAELIKIQTDKAVYRFGEPIQCTAYVYNAQLQPIVDAHVQLIFNQNSEKQPIDMTACQGGKYTAVIQPAAAGHYTLQLTVLTEGKELGCAQTQCTVGEYNQELNETAMQAALLKKMAQVSGGSFATADSAAWLLKKIHGNDHIRITDHSAQIWNQAETMLALIALLAAEWYTRRKKGMV